MKTLVVYVLSTDDKYSVNIDKFVSDGIFESDDVKFIIVCNGKNTQLKNLPLYVTVIERENIGYDFGAWGDVLMNHINYQDYDNFMFINSSVYGPILPVYADKTSWVSIFTSRFNESVKLVGCTINYEYRPHIQSYCWGVDKIFLEYLFTEKYFENIVTKNDAIYKCEINNIVLLEKAGYKYYVVQPDIGVYGYMNPTLFDITRTLWNDPYCLVFVKYTNYINDDIMKRIVSYKFPKNTDVHIVVVDSVVDTTVFNSTKFIVHNVVKKELLAYLIINFMQKQLLIPYVNPHFKDTHENIYKYLSFPTNNKFIVVSDESININSIPTVVPDSKEDILKQIEYKLSIWYRTDCKIKID